MTYASYPPYTLLSKASQIRERIAFVIENLTPELAPNITFARLIKWPAKTDSDAGSDRGEPGWQQLEMTTSVARWRMFYVRVSAWAKGDNVDNTESFNLASRIEVLVGIPEEAILKYNPEDPVNVFDAEDIISHDVEQLVDELQNVGIFGAISGEPAIDDVDNITFENGARSPRALALVFTVRYKRTR